MVIEGGLRKPEREAIKINDSKFWSEEDLDIELRRQFDVCHSCRRCFNLCDSFPKLFDLIDDCLLYTSPSPRDRSLSRMPSSA